MVRSPDALHPRELEKARHTCAGVVAMQPFGTQSWCQAAGAQPAQSLDAIGESGGQHLGHPLRMGFLEGLPHGKQLRGPPGLVRRGKTRQGSPGPKMPGGVICLVNPPSQVTLLPLTLGFLVLGLFLSWLEMGFIKLSPVNISVH